jgi:hypothetical protein
MDLEYLNRSVGLVPHPFMISICLKERLRVGNIPKNYSTTVWREEIKMSQYYSKAGNLLVPY